MTNVFNGIVKDVTVLTDGKLSASALDRFQDRAIEEFRRAREHTCDLVKQLTRKDERKEE